MSSPEGTPRWSRGCSSASSSSLRTPPSARINYRQRRPHNRKPTNSADAIIIKTESDPPSPGPSANPTEKSIFGAEDPFSLCTRYTGIDEVDETDYVIQKILARSLFRHPGPVSKVEWRYLVRWEGYSPEFDTWEPESGLLESASMMLRSFQKTRPSYSILSARTNYDLRTPIRQFLVRVPDAEESTPHAEQNWLSLDQMKLRSMTDATRRTRNFLVNRKGEKERDKELRALVTAKKRVAESLPAESARETKRTKQLAAEAITLRTTLILSSGPSAYPKLIEVLSVQAVKRKYTGLSHVRIYTVRHTSVEEKYTCGRPPANGQIFEAAFSEYRAFKLFGREQVRQATAAWREKNKIDSEAVERATRDSEYEIQRKKQIEENQALLRTLGF